MAEKQTEKIENMAIPAHVAIILDGNGRWAKKRGLPRSMGHKEGCKTVEKTVELAARMGIEYLTVYGFSTENWKRSGEEVGALMQLFRYYMVRLLKIAKANNVRVKMIGERSRFDQDIVEGINRLEEETRENTGLTFVIAVNYGGRVDNSLSGRKAKVRGHHRADYRNVPGYRRNAGSGSADPYQRGDPPVQLFAVAVRLYGDLCYRLSVAGF